MECSGIQSSGVARETETETETACSREQWECSETESSGVQCGREQWD